MEETNLSVSIPFSAAYSMYISQKQNVITIGRNEVCIVEDFKAPDELKPGIEIIKKVQVKNTGNVPCYVRAFAEYTNSAMKQYSETDFNTEDWTRKGSYYYYNGYLEPGKLTEPLFTKIKISEDISLEVLEAFDVLVYAESRQTEGYETAEEVWN